MAFEIAAGFLIARGEPELDEEPMKVDDILSLSGCDRLLERDAVLVRPVP